MSAGACSMDCIEFKMMVSWATKYIAWLYYFWVSCCWQLHVDYFDSWIHRNAFCIYILTAIVQIFHLLHPSLSHRNNISPIWIGYISEDKDIAPSIWLPSVVLSWRQSQHKSILLHFLLFLCLAFLWSARKMSALFYDLYATSKIMFCTYISYTCICLPTCSSD